MKPLWAYAGACVVALLGGVALGRGCAPAHVETVETVRTVTVDRVDTAAAERVRQLTAELDTLKANARMETTVVEWPDGKKETHTVAEVQVERVTDTQSDVDRYRQEHTARQTETTAATQRSHVEDRPGAEWKVSALAGVSVPGLVPVYGALVERRILGPVSVGVWGLSSGHAGVALSIEF